MLNKLYFFSWFLLRIKIPLDKSSTTLVVGENGAGKSTLLDALCFGLFQRPFRNIKKDQLIKRFTSPVCTLKIQNNTELAYTKIKRTLDIVGRAVEGIKKNVIAVDR